MSDKRSGKSPEIPQTTRIVVLITMFNSMYVHCSGDDRNGVAILGHGGGELYDLQQGLYGRMRHQGRLCRGGS